MNLEPSIQINLFGLENYLDELINLYEKNILPNKIILSGQKGSGKCTLAYHLINYILSKGEEFSYEKNEYKINENNRSFKLISNRTNINFNLIDVNKEKKFIDISQIRDLINSLNKSSLNDKPRFVLIDNIEFLNTNSINALLKIIEEPTKNVYFILINNNKKILPTLISRCLNFRITLTHLDSIKIVKKLIKNNLLDEINVDLINYYMTPGLIYNLYNFSKKNDIDLKEISLKKFLMILIKNDYFKKDDFIKFIIYDLIEYFLAKNAHLDIDNSIKNYTYFSRKIFNTKKFNLDQETLFMEFKSKLLNG